MSVAQIQANQCCASVLFTSCSSDCNLPMSIRRSATGLQHRRLFGEALSNAPQGMHAMDLSRRQFLQLSTGAGAGTALGTLVGLGVNLTPATTHAQHLRIQDAQVTPSVCPYCSVGCATLVHTIAGRIVNIEGDPRSPHNEGALCPKGAAIYQLHVNPNRPTQVLHRAPGATQWEVWDLQRAMDRVAELVAKTRDATFVERLPDGRVVNMTPAIFSLGGATLDNEWNHLQQKLMRGLGIVAIENQARI